MAQPQTKPAEGQTFEEILHPTVVSEVAPEGVIPTFKPVKPRTASHAILPEYTTESFPQALGFLHLAADESSLWAAGGPLETPPPGSKAGALTLLRDAGGIWTPALGPAG